MKDILVGLFGYIASLCIAVAAALLQNQLVFTIAICLFLFVLLVSLVNKTKFGKKTLLYLRGIYWSFRLKKAGKRLTVGEKVQFFSPKKITFGDNCDIAQNVVFAPLNTRHGENYPSKIIVGNGVHFGAFDRIASMNEVRIDDNVLFAAFVHVTDHSHQYEDPNVPVTHQGVFSKGPVHIKEGAWLAFGCHILSGVTVGKNSVIAANSVVTKDVPDYTVVAGNPARIISRYNFETMKWERCKNDKK